MNKVIAGEKTVNLPLDKYFKPHLLQIAKVPWSGFFYISQSRWRVFGRK